MSNKRKDKILVFCHDSGGAEVVSAYVNKNKHNYNFICFVAGPAEKIFKRKKIKVFVLSDDFSRFKKSIFDAHKDTVKLIAGSSWLSPMERDFIQYAKSEGIATISYLDHWVNFLQRFGYPEVGWKKNLPDEIWVGDEIAFKAARREFKNMPTSVRLVPNFYLEELKKEIKKSKSGASEGGILFMGEPINISAVTDFGSIEYLLFDEFEILEKLIIVMIENGVKKSLIVRLHPIEKDDKYDWIIKKYQGRIKVIKSYGNKISYDLARSSLIIGMESTALAIAYLLGKKVISICPWRKEIFRLPFKTTKISEIKNLGSATKRLLASN